jgi:predicted dienelactone hydrolase
MKCVTAIISILALNAGALPASGQGIGRELVRERLKRVLEQQAPSGRYSAPSPRKVIGDLEKYDIAGLDVAVWEPRQRAGCVPLVLFSHGFHGRNTQSAVLARAMADAGYLVMAPNHRDANSKYVPPPIPFKKPELWSESTFKDRGADITNLLEALRQDRHWSERIDWTKVALCGHSLGGYTCLALAGAWPSWKLQGIKAVLALSPYARPFLSHGNLKRLGIPVMYQGGSRDILITPHLRKPLGAFDQTSSPAYLVDFVGASHFAWTILNRDQRQQQLINRYCVAFLDRYVKGNPDADPGAKLAGVLEVKTK